MMTNLIYDRTLEDVAEVRRLLAKLDPETGDGLTAAEQAKWDAGLKGAYNFTDLNRVEAAVKTLAVALTSAGYPVSVTPVLKGSSRVPAGYTEVEWIQSSGTQYIDSGVKGDSDVRVTADFEITAFGSGTTFVFGAQGTDSIRYTLGMTSAGAFRSDFGTAMTSGSAASLNTRYSADKNGNVCTVGGQTLTSAAATFTGTTNIYLFARSYSSISCSQIKMYRCKMYKGGTLVRDFVPARNSSGTLGLYDTVNGAFYTNAGSGTFTAGAEVGKAEDREWQEGDVLYRSQWTTYLDNVQRLRDAYYTLAETGALPAPGDKLAYTGANTIEKVLADIDLLIDCMKSSYRRCGTFRAGNNAAHLPLKGSV